MTFAGGRAILMELAHPAIAQAVAEFDHFREDPGRRASLTAKAFREVIHGSESEAAEVARRLAAVHRRVRGVGYAASDPELLLWVHATFVDSLLCIGQRLHGRLTFAEQRDFYRDAVTVGEVFGCAPSTQPPTFEEFRRYVDEMVGTLTVCDTGRDLARAVFWPTVPSTRKPLIAAYRLACFGTTPASLRDQFGYPWNHVDMRVFAAGTAVAPRLAPWTDRAFFAVADGNGRGVAAALALAGIRNAGA
jgi:uncharacterized protein (DUF2236 family)